MKDQSKAAGGFARAAKLTPERRTEIARAAAVSRWAGHTKKVKAPPKRKRADMTEMELRDIVKKTVLEHGPAEATKILEARAQTDRAFLRAAATYGMAVVSAPLIAEAAKDSVKH